ncbi:MAG: flagellar export protein FliJ [Campylobacterales bacterium]
MKTKFTAVVKIRKKAVDDIENAIFAVESLITKTKANLLETKNRFNSLEPPHSGPYSALMAFEDMKKAFRFEIEGLKALLADHQNRKNMLIGQLKEANAELEKMKYLDGEEIKKVLKARAVREAKELDEIGVMLYNNRSEN